MLLFVVRLVVVGCLCCLFLRLLVVVCCPFMFFLVAAYDWLVVGSSLMRVVSCLFVVSCFCVCLSLSVVRVRSLFVVRCSLLVVRCLWL